LQVKVKLQGTAKHNKN